MHTLYLIRGLPGSGKSSFADILLHTGVVNYSFEADDYFIDENLEYRFEASKLKDAHEWCQINTKARLKFDSVVVSNTSTTEKEVETYRKIAEEVGAKFVSIVVENRHEGKNIHNVPEEALQRMKNRFTLKLI